MALILHGCSEITSVKAALLAASFSEMTEIWVNTLEGFPGRDDTRKIFVAVEPDCISGFRSFLLKNAARFEAILTFDEGLLATLPNARLFEFGTTWISDYSFPEKEFGVSMVCGFKTQAPGHQLRHQLWGRYDELQIPAHFFVSSQLGGGLGWWIKSYFRQKKHPVLGGDKSALFRWQFHLAIENSQGAYYFTEKLIDCLRTKTVPVYWGATEIHRYFNPEGMILVQDAQDAISKLNALTTAQYVTMMPAIEENFKLAEQFIHYDARVVAKVQEVLA